MARKKKQEEHENHERWLVSYADFITLLFAFFVVMYSISSVNEGKYRVLSESLVASFRSPAKSLQPIQIGEIAKSPYSEQIDFRQMPVAVDLPDLPMPRFEERSGPKDRRQEEDKQGDEEHSERGGETESAEKPLEQISTEIEAAMSGLINKKLINVRSSDEWVEVEINSNILFPSGRARPSREALKILKRLAEIVEPFPNAIHVEGYTDNVPIHNVFFPSNWELSAGRAASVVHVFTREGVDPGRMVAMGYGQHHPVADNNTAAGRRRNRRVVIVVRSQSHQPGRSEVVAAFEEPEEKDPDAKAAAGDQPAGARSEGADDAGQPARKRRRASSPWPRQPGHFPIITPPIEAPINPMRIFWPEGDSDTGEPAP